MAVATRRGEQVTGHIETTTRAYRWLLWSSAIYVVGLVSHTADHVRRGISVLTGPVLGAGTLSTIAGIVIVWLIVARNRKAPFLAAIFGPTTAIGVVIVHVPPHWGVFSDPFIGSTGTGVTAFSWIVVFLEVAGLLAMGISGIAVLREQSMEVLAR